MAFDSDEQRRAFFGKFGDKGTKGLRRVKGSKASGVEPTSTSARGGPGGFVARANPSARLRERFRKLKTQAEAELSSSSEYPVRLTEEKGGYYAITYRTPEGPRKSLTRMTRGQMLRAANRWNK